MYSQRVWENVAPRKLNRAAELKTEFRKLKVSLLSRSEIKCASETEQIERPSKAIPWS